MKEQRTCEITHQDKLSMHLVTETAGARVCQVCGQGEDILTTHCPGKITTCKCDPEDGWDFRFGRWVKDIKSRRRIDDPVEFVENEEKFLRTLNMSLQADRVCAQEVSSVIKRVGKLISYVVYETRESDSVFMDDEHREFRFESKRSAIAQLKEQGFSEEEIGEFHIKREAKRGFSGRIPDEVKSPNVAMC